MAEEALWTIDELVAAAGGRLEGRPSEPLNGVAIDSRSIGRGDIFVAIKGDRLDGHDFVTAALKAGAGVAIVSRASSEMAAAGALLVVDDPLEALGRLGEAARARSGAVIVAVTGSVGKTSTKEALKLAFAASGQTHASAASFNNHWGVPLTLARMHRRTAYGIFEIGMNHAGEITPLVKMVRPHIAIITTIAPSHIGNLGSMEAIADAKAEIFLGLEKAGHAIINRDTLYFDRLAAAARQAGIASITGFGKDPSAEARIEQIKLHETCSCITARILDEQVVYKLGSPGEHQAVNSLSALAAVKLVGADLARAAMALAAYESAKGRGTRLKLSAPGGFLTLIDESYNANPVSMRAALALLGTAQPGKNGRRIAVLGDMLELGSESAAMHAGLSDAVDEAKTDVLFAAGPLMQHLWAETPKQRRGDFAEKSEDLRQPLLAGLRAGDVIMVKGSLGSRMGPLVEAIKGQFPIADKEA